MTDPYINLADEFSRSATASSGVLTEADFLTLFKTLRDNARAEPEVFSISPETERWLWRAGLRSCLYARYPLPKRRLRKTALRRRQAKIDQGQRRIRRLERQIEALQRLGCLV